MNFDLKNTLFLSFSLIPFFLIFGPAVPEIIIFLIIIIFLKENFSYGKIKKYLDKIFIFFSIFFVYVFLISFVNFFNNSIDLITLIKSFLLIRFTLFYISIKWLCENIDDKQIKKFIFIFIFTISFVIIDLIIQYFFKVDLLGYQAFVPGTPTAYRLTGPFGDELIAGSYLMKFSLIFSFFTIISFKVNKTFYLPTLFLFLAVVIFITGERAAIILFVFGVILFLLFSRFYLSLLFFTTLFLVSISFVTFFDSNIKQRMVNYTLYQLNLNNLLDNNVDKNNTINSFIDNPYGAHYETAYNVFKDHKFFGAGYKQFRVICLEEKYFDKAKSKLKEVRCSTHPHNIYLEILSETGIVGFIIFILIIFSIFFNLLKYKKKNYFIILQICLFFFPFISSGSFFTNKNLIYIFFIISLSFIIHRDEIFKKTKLKILK
tara:strand:+ start:140 stop:1435 length:1296 start_codon:yes stop_codon:yes gene_type:complete